MSQFTNPTMDTSEFMAPENVMLRTKKDIEQMRETINNLKHQHPETFRPHGGKKRSNRRKHARYNKRTRKGSRVHKKCIKNH